MKLRKRVFKITLKDKNMVDEFVNRLLQELKIDQTKIDVKENTITITLYGTKDVIAYNWQVVRNIAKEITYLRNLEKAKLKKYVHNTLQRHVGTTFPLDALGEVLKAKGYIVKLEENTLISDAPLDIVVHYAKALGNTLQNLRTYTRSSSTKKFLATLATILEIGDLDEVKRLGLKEGVLVENEIGHVILTLEWKQALNKILKKVR